MSGRAGFDALLDRATALDRHVRAAEDRTAVYRLLVDLQTAMDERDLTRYGALYTDDGEWCAVSGRAIGPANIAAFLKDYCKPWESPDQQSYHSIADVAIDLYGDLALATGQWRHDHPAGKNPPVTVHFGRFEVVAQRTSEGWRVKRRASYSLLPYLEARHQLVGAFEAEQLIEAAKRRNASTEAPLPGDVGPDELQKRLNDLAGRVQEAEDRDAIDRLFIDLQTAMDERDLDRYGALYTEDGEWCAVNGRAIGPQVISNHLSQYCKPWESPARRSYHSLSDVIVDLDGDRATAHGQWQHTHPDDQGHPVTQVFGRFEAVLRRTVQGWRLERRASYLLIPYVEPQYQLMGPAEAAAAGTNPLAGIRPPQRSGTTRAPTEEALSQQLQDLEKRMQKIEDRVDITRLFLRLQEATDGRDGTAYGLCFTEDGEWSGVSSYAVGRSEITRFMSEFMPPWPSEAARTYHSISDLAIDLNGDWATARVQYRHRKCGEDGRPAAFHFCRYEAILRRTPDGWLFRRRDSYMDLPYAAPKFQLTGLAEAQAVSA